MSQTKGRSLTEVVCNTVTGLVVAYFVWNYVILPYAVSQSWDMNVLVWWQVFMVNIVFTVVSVVRGYFWRRLFNRGDT